MKSKVWNEGMFNERAWRDDVDGEIQMLLDGSNGRLFINNTSDNPPMRSKENPSMSKTKGGGT